MLRDAWRGCAKGSVRESDEFFNSEHAGIDSGRSRGGFKVSTETPFCCPFCCDCIISRTRAATLL